MQALDHQAGTRQQYERECELGHYEAMPYSPALNTTGVARAHDLPAVRFSPFHEHWQKPRKGGNQESGCHREGESSRI